MNKPFYFQMEVKEVNQGADGDVIIEGFASTPDLDRYRDIVEPKAFADAVDMYMKNPVILYQHNADLPVGVATSTKITDKGFWIRASIKDAGTKEKVLDGRMRAFSIGYLALESALQHEDGTAFNSEKDSIWDPNLVRVIKKLDLVEISIVSTPANGNALFTIAKSVKKYFNDLVTKSLSMEIKETPANEIDANEAKPVEKVEEPAEVVPPAVAPEAVASEAETEEDKKKKVEGATDPAVPAAEGTTTSTDGQKPQEEIEKGDENAPADSPEAPKGEEGNAEVKPESEVEGEKSFAVSKDVAESLPELVKSGVLVESKEAGKGVDLPKQIVGLLRKLCDEVVIQAKRADDLQGKLDAIPAKSVLPVVGQFESAPSVKASETKKVSAGFQELFKDSL